MRKPGGTEVPPPDQQPQSIEVAVFAQTLTVAGFRIERFDRYIDHALCYCTRDDLVGCEIPYLIALSEPDTFPPETAAEVRRIAIEQARVPLLIANQASEDVLAWAQFTEALGGPVPTWRALVSSFDHEIRILGSNKLPPGAVGEPWFLFESAVADAFEFILGRRVTRLGGRRRGRDVPDSICLTPDRVVAVVDAKASDKPFSVNKTALRPLEDYVAQQRILQSGQPSVGTAIIVANEFAQDVGTLLDESNRFLADTFVPLCVTTTDTLLELVEIIRETPTSRNAVAWRQVFCKAGTLESARLKYELSRVTIQRRTLEN